MLMRLPIQERRAFIRMHNRDSEAIEREIDEATGSTDRTYGSEMINRFAELEQNNQMGGR